MWGRRLEKVVIILLRHNQHQVSAGTQHALRVELWSSDITKTYQVDTCAGPFGALAILTSLNQLSWNETQLITNTLLFSYLQLGRHVSLLKTTLISEAR